MSQWKIFLMEDDGTAATEYAIMLTLITLVCVGSLGAFGGRLLGIYTRISGGLDAAE